MIRNISPRLAAKVMILLYVVIACSISVFSCREKAEHKTKIMLPSIDSSILKIEKETRKIDSIHHEKEKIPYRYPDSVRDVFWR